MPRRSGDWWLVTSHSQLLIPNLYLEISRGMKKAKGAYFLERKCSNFLGSPKFFGGG